MKKLYPLWRFIGHNKYWIVAFFGVLIVGFLDHNSVLQHVKNRMEINNLKSETQRYNQQYERDRQKLQQLKTNPKVITKIARENYFMKADDEDIFVLSTDGETPSTDETNNHATTE